MSLFQCREWWSHQPDQSEESDSGCMILADIDNSGEQNEKIITGNFQGILRVFAPKQQGFRAPDLRLEQNLGAPILQILAGQFVPGTKELALAVLHPRQLVVYMVKVNQAGFSEKSTEDDIFFSLQKQYHHRLTRTACNMCHGTFGGRYSGDSICVQSMDGQLFVLEQDSFSFARFLNDFLVPGPIAYLPGTDCIVTVNSAMHVQCYKYRTLCTSMGGRDSKDQLGLKASKNKIQLSWDYNLGEHAVTLKNTRLSSNLGAGQSDVVIIGEQSLVILKETGESTNQSRWGYSPAACCSFPAGEGKKSHLLVATSHKTLQVYDDSKLLWSAQAPFVPVEVKVGTFGGVRGMIVLFGDAGQLAVSYLGTDPMSQIASVPETRDLDYDSMDKEHKSLLKVIRDSANSSLTEPSDKIVIQAQVPHTLTHDRIDNEDAATGDGGVHICVKIALNISYTGSGTCKDVIVNFNTPEAILMESNTLVIPEVRGGRPSTPLIYNVSFFISKSIQPSNIKVELTASFTSPEGAPRTTWLSFNMPFCLFAKVIPPVNASNFAYTLETKQPNPPLSTLFGDIFRPAVAAQPDLAGHSDKLMSVRFHCGSEVTIRLSKNRIKCRLQSTRFEALWLVTNQLIRRLTSYTSRINQQNKQNGKEVVSLGLSFNELLPTKEYFRLIDKHFEIRLAMMQLSHALENSASQFRVVQKRLLVRYKHKNPSPLMDLDLLLHETFMRLNALSDRMQKCEADLRVASSNLSCGTHLLLLLLRYKFRFDSKNAYLMEAFLSPIVTDSNGQGWEERTKASMLHLLRSVLVKSDRAKPNMFQASTVEMMSDTSKLKRNIQLVCERLAKGYRVYKPAVRKKPSNAEAKARQSVASSKPQGSEQGGEMKQPSQSPAPPPRL